MQNNTTQNLKLKAQNYNSKLTSFELRVKVLPFEFCLLSYSQTGGLN